MNITYVVGEFPKISETFILDQIAYLIDQGHNVNIIADRDPAESATNEKVEKYKLRAKTTYLNRTGNGSEFQLNGSLLKAILMSDLIHAHFAKSPAHVAMKLAKIFQIPFVFTAHAYDIFIKPDVTFLTELADNAARIITISQFNKNYLLRLLGERFETKILIIRCSIDLTRFRPIEKTNSKTIRLLTCGRLVEKKGIEYAIWALSKLSNFSNVELHIIGDGPLRSELESLVEHLQLANRITFLGSQSHENVILQLKQADIFLLPSVTAKNGDREGIPVALLEAEASGIPVISTIHSGIPEGVLDGYSGVLVPEADIAGLASAIEELAGDKEKRNLMGQNGRHFIEQNFNNELELPKLHSLFERLVPAEKRISTFSNTSTPDLLERASSFSDAQLRQKDLEMSNISHDLERIKKIAAPLTDPNGPYALINRHLEYLYLELTSVRRSLAWRLTQPIRKIIYLLRSLGSLPEKGAVTGPDQILLRPPKFPEKAIRKVLYVLDVFPKLSETFVLNEIHELMARGIEVDIVALRNPFEPVLNKKVLSNNLLTRCRWVGEGSRKFYLNPKIIRAHYSDVSIVHAHFAFKASRLGAQIASILEKPYTVTAHAFEIFQRPNRRKLRKTFGKVSTLITPSEYNKKYIQEILGYKKGNIQIVRATIDAAQFVPPQLSRPSIGDRKHILVVGRLVEKKGIIYLLEAMKEVIRKYPDTVLNIIGTGPLQSQLEASAHELRIKKSVRFLGNVSNEDCARILSQSDIAVLPCIIASDGDRDVCPLTIQEAMAMQLPVVATDIASISELVKHRENGILVPERNSQALADAIIELIGDASLARDMGLTGRQIIESEFNIRNQVTKLLGIWNDLV